MTDLYTDSTYPLQALTQSDTFLRKLGVVKEIVDDEAVSAQVILAVSLFSSCIFCICDLCWFSQQHYSSSLSAQINWKMWVLLRVLEWQKCMALMYSLKIYRYNLLN